MLRSSRWVVVCGGLWLAACSGSATSSTDAGQPLDSGAVDSGPVDAGAVDAGAVDAGPIDAGPTDAGPSDAGAIDAGPNDAGPDTGTLAISVSAPSSVSAPAVTVTGPSYLDVLSASSQLTLSPGIYDVTASPLTTTDPIVGTELLPTITGSPATVAAGETSNVDVAFGPAAVPATGRVWIEDCDNGTGSVYGVPADRLRPDAGTTFNPDTIASATAAGARCLSGVAFDRAGRLWAGNGYEGDIIGKVYGFTFSPDGGAQLATVIQPDAGMTIASLAFARNGDLYALDTGIDRLYRWTPAQLDDALDGGNPAPVTISAAYYLNGGNSLSQPTGMAFDRAGNLWVVNIFNASVVEFAFQPDGGFPMFSDGGFNAIPNIQIGDDGSQLMKGPLALAFDGTGKLWIADITSDAIYAIDPSALQPGTNVIQPLTIFQYTDGGPRYLHDVSSITFDNSGAMWLAGYAKSLVEIADPGSYTGRAVPPAVLAQDYSVSGPAGGLSAIVFDPPAPNLYPNP